MTKEKKESPTDTDPCMTPGCDKKAVASWGKGICRSCYGVFKRMIDEGETTWDELVILGCCTDKQPARVHFLTMKRERERGLQSVQEESSEEEIRILNRDYSHELQAWDALCQARLQVLKTQDWGKYINAVYNYHSFIAFKEETSNQKEEYNFRPEVGAIFDGGVPTQEATRQEERGSKFHPDTIGRAEAIQAYKKANDKEGPDGVYNG